MHTRYSFYADFWCLPSFCQPYIRDVSQGCTGSSATGLFSEVAVYFPYNCSIISADPLAPFQAKGVPSQAVRGGSWNAGAAATGLGCLRSLLASIASRRRFDDKPGCWRSVSEHVDTSVASRVRLVWESMAAHCCSIASCFSGFDCWLTLWSNSQYSACILSVAAAILPGRRLCAVASFQHFC
jgi:hypothetical protein